MSEIRPISIKDSAFLAAKKAVETHEPEPNPHPAGSPEAAEWQKWYHVGLVKYSAEVMA